MAFASANTISSSADNAKLIHTVDIDGDGDMDVLSASYGDDTIAWYENNGSESFTERPSTVVRMGLGRSLAWMWMVMAMWTFWPRLTAL